MTANISVSANVDSLLLQNADLESTVVHALKEQIKHLQLNLEQQHTIQHVPSNVSESESAKDEKDSAKHDLEKAMQVITFSARALKGALSKRGDEMLEKRSEEVVQVLDDFISKQRDMRCREDAFAKGGSMTWVPPTVSPTDLKTSANAEGDSSTANKEEVALLEEKTSGLELELQECRNDRKVYSARLEVAERENNNLKDTVEHLRKQVAKLTALRFVLANVNLGFGSSDRHEELNLDGNLDISLAVMATEPDISQLMEDLEVIAKEKDVLLADNLEVSKTVITQKHDFLESQQKLREQLRSLEVSIQSKEKLIHELQESQMQTKEMAAKYEIRAGQGSLLYHHYFLSK